MSESGPGKGMLVPSGKHAPAWGVEYEISHYMAETGRSNGGAVEQKRAAVQFVAESKGQPIPLGDFDLVAGGQIIRLKHIAGEPEWLVLSSNA